MIGFLFLLFLPEAFSSSEATVWSNEYDATNTLNDTIIGLFQIAGSQNTAKWINSLLHSDSIDHYDREMPYKYDYIWPNGEKTVVWFDNIWLQDISSTNLCATFGFYNNTIQLYSPQFIAYLSGKMHLGGVYYFNSVTIFKECTISMIRWLNTSDNSFVIDFQYDWADISITIDNEVEEWFKLSLIENCKRVLPSMVRTFMNRNKKLQHVLNEIHNNPSTKHIFSEHPRSSDHESQIRYTIPSFPIGSLNLKDIVVKGLSNYHFLNFTIERDNIVTYHLLMKDIRGSMILEDASNTAASTLKFNFFIDTLSIFVTQQINRINVKAENYSIIEVKSNTSLNNAKSDIMMDQIERAIGTSLMPSMEYQRTSRWSTFMDPPEIELIIRNHLIEKLTHFDQSAVSQPETSNHFESSTNTIDQIQCGKEPSNIIYNYHISFHDINLNLLSGNPEYPNGAHCALSTNNSSITHRIKVTPSGKFRSDNKTGNTIEMNFNFNYPAVNLSSAKPKNSEKNDSCEFQIRNNRDIRVELSPSDNTTESKVQIRMKKKIDETLMSMAKTRIVQTVKPIVCKSFDICRQSTKLINDFCQKFVDILLQKCSFRSIQT